MCRIKLCTFPDLVDSRDALYDLTDDSDPFETMQLPMPWEEPPHDQQRGDLAVVETTPWLEENRILRTLEHSGRVQRQRLMLIYELSTLVQEEEQHTSEELQYHRRVQGGETERADWHRRDRLQSLRMQQDLIMPEFWALDQSVRELILEEHQLRDVYDLEDLVTTSPPPY
ncbi:hypothetical protein J1614_010724 [Plenodomus biglobosus]|nr:hypothetical protein J1614_010717 [Plenodomus biglobosus]KAH9862947.1 hypothetical protein J1614_010724 [Plenodomus biglobosus]